MVLKLLLYRKGMLRISVTGESYDRFLNLCANHEIALWNLEYHGNTYEMDISVQGFRMLRPLVKKSRTRVRIIRRQGLPFFLYRCRKKKMLFAGLLCGILLLYFMSCFLWRIDIEGNQQITRGQICRYLETVHIENGTRISVIDCKELAAMLRKQFDAFTWVSVKQEGTRLLIQVKESTDPEANVENNEKKETEGTNPANLPTDLIADKNGVITSMITRKGVPMVSVGDTVKKGDLLVKGELEILDDSGEVSGYQYCASDADIFLKTSYEYREKIRLKRKEKHYSGKEEQKIGLRVGKWQMYLPGAGKKIQTFDTVTEMHPLCIFQNFYLPVSFEKQQFFEYTYETVTLTEEEASAMAEKDLYDFLNKIQEKGVQIFENNVKIEFDTNYCIAKGSVILIEKAGKSVERITTE